MAVNVQGRNLRQSLHSGRENSVAAEEAETTSLEEQDGLFSHRRKRPTSVPVNVPPAPSPVNVRPPTSQPYSDGSSGTCQKLLWMDDFTNPDGAVDETIWNFDEGNGSQGWGNSELQYYKRDNSRTQDGSLFMTIQEERGENGKRSFSSVRINTQDKLEVLYGNIEARIKMPSTLADGLWPAFWTLGGNFREVGWPAAGEIDIMEMGSEQARINNQIDNRVTSAVHWENSNIRASFGQSFASQNLLTDGQFHIYRMEWTSSKISTFVDNNVILEFSLSPDSCTDCEEYRQPHFLLLNVAVGGTFTGIMNEAGISVPLPAAMEVDYVRVCDNGETILSGSVVENPITFGFDCALPDTCTTSALNNYAGDTRCGSRIQALINSGMSELEACAQVGGEEFPEYCGSCFEETIDCGVSKTCTAQVLRSDAGGYQCGARIKYLVGTGNNEVEACSIVAVEFPKECGACAPSARSIDCSLPETCTSTVLSRVAGGFPCGERIEFLMRTQGETQLSACTKIAKVEYPQECGPCAPPTPEVNCGRPSTCTISVLEKDAAGFSCGDRILFLIKSNGKSETEACTQVAVTEFPQQCGACAPAK